MAFPWGALIGAIGGAAGGAQGQQSTEKLWKMQRRFEERRYQTMVADMRAAGLNPMLAAGGGDTPSAPGASVPQETVSGAVSSALQSMRLKKDIEVADAQIENLKQDTDKKVSERALNSAVYNRVLEETTGQQISNALQTFLKPAFRLESEVSSSAVGKFSAYAERLLRSIGIGGSSAKSILRVPK